MDLDGDGHRDVISGSWPGELYIFKGKAEGGFAEKTKIQDKDGKDINVGNASALCATDWDRDGDLDLVVGCIDGWVWHIPNESGDKTLKFGAATKISAAGSEIHEHHSGPVVVDWDGNGTLDLIVGQGDGCVFFYPNSARSGAPKLAAGETLVEGKKSMPDGSTCGYRVKPTVVDWNGDGRLDLLVGDFSMGKPKTLDLTEEQKKKLADLEAELQANQEKLMPLYQEATKKVMAELGIEAEDEEAMRKAFGEMSDEQRKEYSQKIRKMIEGNEEIAALSTRMQELHKEMQPLRPSPPVQGNVWVLLRSAPEATTTVGGN